jgi:hypothetical protein
VGDGEREGLEFWGTLRAGMIWHSTAEFHTKRLGGHFGRRGSSRSFFLLTSLASPLLLLCSRGHSGSPHTGVLSYARLIRGLSGDDLASPTGMYLSYRVQVLSALSLAWHCGHSAPMCW